MILFVLCPDSTNELQMFIKYKNGFKKSIEHPLSKVTVRFRVEGGLAASHGIIP